MNLPGHLRGAAGFAVGCVPKRKLAENLPRLVIGVDAKTRGLSLDATVRVLIAAVGRGNLVRMARRLGTDEVMGAVADACNANARMNLALMDFGKRK
jgi:hypothetical protein